MPPRDELGEDGDGDLLLAAGTEIEAGRAAHPAHVLLAEPLLPQRGHGTVDARFELATSPT